MRKGVQLESPQCLNVVDDDMVSERICEREQQTQTSRDEQSRARMVAAAVESLNK